MNRDCSHNGSPVASVRGMFLSGNYHLVPAEAARMRESGLTGSQELVVAVTELMANLELGTMLFRDASVLFDAMTERVQLWTDEQDRDVFLSELRFLHIVYADQFDRPALRDYLMSCFFHGINDESVPAQNEYLLAQGVLAVRRHELSAALTYFTAGMTLVLHHGVDDPCKLEMATRYVARAYQGMSRSDDARRVLTDLGLPTDDESLELLLHVPGL